MTATAARIGAVAIALVALVDPPVSRMRPARQVATVVLVQQRTLGESDAPTARGRRAGESVAALVAALADDFDVRTLAQPPTRDAAACPEAGACFLVTDGALPTRLTAGAVLVGAVRVDAAERPAVAVTKVETPPVVHLDSAAELRVHLRGVGVDGRSLIQVLDSGTLVGEAAHAWSGSEPGAVERVVVPVNWIPIGAGIRHLRVSVTPAASELTIADNEADVGVDVTAARAAVVFHEAEPTWRGTFTRRALDGDPRFAIGGTTRVTTARVVARGSGPTVTAATLAQAAVVIVTVPNALSAAEVDLLDRFARVRGGTLVLLADRSMTGPVQRLAGQAGVTRVEAQPVAVGPLRASEVVSFTVQGAEWTVLESAADRAVIVERATGRGRVVLAGAADAWKHRGPAFDRFWSQLVWEGASLAGPSIGATAEPAVIQVGGRARVQVDVNALDEWPETTTAQARVECGPRTWPMRLWPVDRPGRWTGTIDVSHAGACRIRATVDAAETGAGLLVVEESRAAVADDAILDRALAAHDAIAVAPGSERALAARARERVPAELVETDGYPMRSAWWIVPLIACLGVAWRLR